MADHSTKTNRAATSFLILVLLAAIILTGLFAPIGSQGTNLVITMILFTIMLCAIGKYVSGRITGIVINERNLVSLSRFQIVIWTVIILSTYVFAVLQRFQNPDVEDPLAVGLATELWWLLGISTASVVGSPLILSGKTTKEPQKETVKQTANALSEDETEIQMHRKGLLYVNSDIDDAALTDMFQGDEIGNTAHVDISKVQMFLFTVVAALSYIFAAVKWVNNVDPEYLNNLPNVSEGLIAILGISHAGYLSAKTFDHTKVQ